jgi:hypothetical protein
MCMQACCTMYAMSGRVTVKYCSASAKLMYSEGFETAGPVEDGSLPLVLIGVSTGLQLPMNA